MAWLIAWRTSGLPNSLFVRSGWKWYVSIDWYSSTLNSPPSLDLVDLADVERGGVDLARFRALSRVWASGK